MKLYEKIKKSWDNGLLPLALQGTGLIVLGTYLLSNILSNVSFTKENKFNDLEKSSFSEEVLKNSNNSNNIKVSGNFLYVDINKDGEYDAIIHPAPVRGGCSEITKLR